MLTARPVLTPPPLDAAGPVLTPPTTTLSLIDFNKAKPSPNIGVGLGLALRSKPDLHISDASAAAQSRPLTATRQLCGTKRAGTADESESDSDEGERAFARICRSGRKRVRRTPSLSYVRAPSPQTLHSGDEEDRPFSRAPRQHRVVSFADCTSSSETLGAAMVPAARIARRRRSMVPETDPIARQRCYDYLLTAIDAAWAEYCDLTSHAEAQLYMPRSPISDADPENVAECESPGSPLTACELLSSASEQPYSQRLMRLKQRLLDAKYKTADLLEGHSLDSSLRFWRHWDAVKYAAADLVESDEDEQDLVFEQLERGRFLN